MCRLLFWDQLLDNVVMEECSCLELLKMVVGVIITVKWN